MRRTPKSTRRAEKESLFYRKAIILSFYLLEKKREPNKRGSPARVHGDSPQELEGCGKTPGQGSPVLGQNFKREKIGLINSTKEALNGDCKIHETSVDSTRKGDPKEHRIGATKCPAVEDEPEREKSSKKENVDGRGPTPCPGALAEIKGSSFEECQSGPHKTRGAE